MDKVLPLTEKVHSKKVQRLFEKSRDYFVAFELRDPTDDEAERFFLAVPDGVKLQNKLTFGIFHHNKLAGVIDWLTGYPDKKSLYIGFLLISPEYRNTGKACTLFAKSLHLIEPHYDKKIHLCVEEKNTTAILFWEKVGFKKKKRFTKEVNGYYVSFFKMAKS